MKIRNSGFTIIEVVLLLTVFGLFITTGWFIYGHLQKHMPVTSNTVSQKIPANWLVFRSSGSTFQFSYPPDWTLKKYNEGIEYYRLSGPNSFFINYEFAARNHSVQTASCVAPIIEVSSESLESNYRLVNYRDPGTNDGEVSEIELGNENNGAYPGHCFSGTFIDAPDDHYATLIGAYLSVSADAGSIAITKHVTLPVKGYLDRPEVKTAVAIFKTFKQ
jgi:hypothetical protein